ncbi:antibiotic biosynthesis monooxygenase [Pseudomonas kairouanensis]|uniref:Antibiotic biosynthesis monooxygenase n=1 Tax=Pseudomonas kairouanensis TaxID=2293832 RepID=A0A4Z0AKV6_9PSED|nr:putative quinol monooxygenase [Pseudomonas kairouanensis]TFY87392.1 antibiotic biosynthesis monooxygenase [Pseudomonas kairouanensis]
MSIPLYVTAVFKVKPEGLAPMLALLEVLSEFTREEAGCLGYGYFQAVDDPLQFSSFEAWQSDKHEALHWQSEHLTQALAQAAELLQDTPRISRYRRVC